MLTQFRQDALALVDQLDKYLREGEAPTGLRPWREIDPALNAIRRHIRFSLDRPDPVKPYSPPPGRQVTSGSSIT